MTTKLMSRRQVRGYRNQLKAAVNQCKDGAYVTLDLRTAEKLLEILDRPPTQAWGFQPTHQHLKRCIQYEEIATGHLQTDKPLEDMQKLVAYRDAANCWWFRSPSEFRDNRRFHKLNQETEP